MRLMVVSIFVAFFVRRKADSLGRSRLEGRVSLERRGEGEGLAGAVGGRVNDDRVD